MLNIFQKRLRKKLREDWEKPVRWDRDFTSIRSLFESTCSIEKLDIVDEKTWNDLDMNSVFRKIDVTQTSIGQQYLYRKMRLLQNPNGKLGDDYRIVSTNNLRYWIVFWAGYFCCCGSGRTISPRAN